jgi:hypothetical protein
VIKKIAAVAVCAGVLVGVAGLTGGISGASTSVSAAGTYSKTETIVRENLVNGKEVVVAKNTVTLKVSQSENLRGRQEIDVSWSGAHPTGGIIANENSIDGQQEEYPFVLLECRGVSTTAPKLVDRLSPQTCWTQDASEHFQNSFNTEYPPFRLDQFASKSDRAQVVGAPNPLPTACQFLMAPTQYWVPFIAADGEKYYGGPLGCAGQPPEADVVAGFPSNETFGVTGLDGKGSADFDVWTSDENASLGCSQTVPCSLVAVPIIGVSCDADMTGAQPTDVTGCEAKGAFAPGSLDPVPSGQEDLAVSGSLWWAASNWRNRIVVPLTFATPASACNITNTKQNVVDLYGSELMIQATSQWEPHFCLNPRLFAFEHVETGEPEARNLVAEGSPDAALTSYAQPGGYGRPVVSAPIAVTGFSISYVIDGANGQPYTHLRLTPLLLAKLLTESYPAVLPMQQEDLALAHNPLNITLDPEFIKLNPGITQGVGATEAASELMALNSDSDVMYALTTYINDNPQARAWLDGKPDQYGMVVNPAYRGIKLPVEQWPLKSTFEPKQWYASDVNNCLYNDPEPYLPLVSAPLATLEDISESLQFADPNSTVECQQNGVGAANEKLVALPEQTVGYRFMIGVTPLADDARYGLRSASLQTNSGTYVAPSDTTMEAAIKLLKPDGSIGTWPVPYQAIEADQTAASAYPGTMVVYAAVPTSGLTKVNATDYSQWLQFAVTTGQTPGFGVGQLPPGYLPLTKADGLGTLVAYTLAAAKDVASQNGQVPPLIPPPPVKGSHPPPSGSTTTTTVPASTTVPTTTVAHPPGSGHGHGHKKPHASTVLPPLGDTLPFGLGSGAAAMMLVLAIALFGLLCVPTVYVAGRRRGRW